jgi:hypothetical protein
MIDHCKINELHSSVLVDKTLLISSEKGIRLSSIPLEVSMMRPIPFPILLGDRQVHVTRAHRMRSAVVANLIRDFARWVSAAAR